MPLIKIVLILLLIWLLLLLLLLLVLPPYSLGALEVHVGLLALDTTTVSGQVVDAVAISLRLITVDAFII
jgi:hypothetical protein